MTPTQHERLRKLRDAIKEYGPEHFDMSEWARVRDEDGDGRHCISLSQVAELTVNGEFRLNACGATACFAGHAATVFAVELKKAVEGKPWQMVHDGDIADFLGIRSKPDNWMSVPSPDYGWPEWKSWVFTYYNWPQWAKDIADTETEWAAILAILDELLARSPRTRFPKNPANFKRRLVAAR